MALPKQVQAQLDEVEELEKELEARDAKAKEVEQADTEADDSEPETQEALKLVETEPANTSPTDVEDELTFEQRYRTLQGKYDAEVPRLYDQVRDLEDRIDRLQATAARPKSVEPTKPKEKVSYVTDEDRAEFGEELIDVQRRVAREVSEEYQEQFAKQAEVIKALEEKIANTGNQVGAMSFTQRLAQLVPDFDAIDKDERWIAWLNEHDPMTRAPRRTQAKNAFEAGDAEAVAHYVSLFKGESDTQKPKSQQRQTELEKQVAPNRSGNGSRTQSVGKDSKIYSEREVEAVWNKIQTLTVRGQADEAAKLEAEITTAYIEGRVRH